MMEAQTLQACSQCNTVHQCLADWTCSLIVFLAERGGFSGDALSRPMSGYGNQGPIREGAVASGILACITFLTWLQLLFLQKGRKDVASSPEKLLHYFTSPGGRGQRGNSRGETALHFGGTPWPQIDGVVTHVQITQCSAHTVHT